MVQWPCVIEINMFNWCGWLFSPIFTVNLRKSTRWNFFTGFCQVPNKQNTSHQCQLLQSYWQYCLNLHVLSRYNSKTVCQHKFYSATESLFGTLPKMAKIRPGGWKTARRAAKRPPTGKPKLSRVTSGCGGLMIPLSRVRRSRKNGGYIGVA